MKVQCDVCEKAPATVICCADEAALCASCDVEIHAANKLASKHQRLLLQPLSNNLPPRCDICREKAAFIFCVEDRALFCRECDEPIHVAGTLSGNHQRYLATGIRVALSIPSNNSEPQKSCPEPPTESPIATVIKAPPRQQEDTVPSHAHSVWAVDDLFELSDYEYNDKKGSHVGFGELDWFTDIGVFHDQVSSPSMAAAEVPDFQNTQAINASYYKANKSSLLSKRPRMEILDDDFFVVPDLG